MLARRHVKFGMTHGMLCQVKASFRKGSASSPSLARQYDMIYHMTHGVTTCQFCTAARFDAIIRLCV